MYSIDIQFVCPVSTSPRTTAIAHKASPRNVERMIKSNMGKPGQQEKALARFIASLTSEDIYVVRKQIYQRQAMPC